MHATSLIAWLLGCGMAQPAPSVPEAPPAPECTGFAAPVEDGKLRDHQHTEISGLALHDGVRWVHNDSGDWARIFALDASGKMLADLRLNDVEATDWEDMSLGPGPGGTPHLFLGDIGDNLERRASITVHRLPVPSEPADGKVDADSFELAYRDGAHNAEVLMVDPRDGALWIVTKSDDGVSEVHTATLPDSPGPVRLKRRGTVQFPLETRGTGKATAGDISADGSRIAIRTYTDVWIWERGELSIGEALATEPCRLRLKAQPQGEALAWDGADLLTVSEGAGEPFWRYPAE